MGTKLARNTDVYGVTSRRTVTREIVAPIAPQGVSVFLGQPRRNRFPSVLLQPVGHLSALESTVCVRSAIRLAQSSCVAAKPGLFSPHSRGSLDRCPPC